MSVFFIALKNHSDNSNEQGLLELATRVFGQENIKEVSPGQILISSEKIFMPDGIAEKLGDNFSQGGLGSYFLVPVTAYWGYQDRSVWGWLKEKGV